MQHSQIYTPSVTKRLFDIDDDLLADAQQKLGTSTMAETVREALRRVSARDPGDEYVQLMASLDIPERSELWQR